jgi:hypothetical protein
MDLMREMEKDALTRAFRRLVGRLISVATGLRSTIEGRGTVTNTCIHYSFVSHSPIGSIESLREEEPTPLTG